MQKILQNNILKKLSFALLICLLLSGCTSNNIVSDASSDLILLPDDAEEQSVSLSDAEKKALSSQLAEKWLEKWAEISAEKEMVKAEASIFSFDLTDGGYLTAIVYPSYKTNSAVFYRLSESGVTEYGEYNCGSQFELLKNSSEDYLHFITQYSGSAVGTTYGTNEIDDEYFRVSESSLEPVLHVGRQEFDGNTVSWFSYDLNNNSSEISAEEYAELNAQYSQDGEAVFSINLDKDGDRKNDTFCSFEDNSEELSSAIMASIK